MSMFVTDRYTQSLTRLTNSVTVELNVATAQWRRNAANAHAHLAAVTYGALTASTLSTVVVLLG